MSDDATDSRLARIRAAMEPGVMTIVLQPVVDLRRGVTTGAEALARFALAPNRTPDVWFNEAWDVGLGIELEVAAIRKALESLDQLPRDAHLAVNASPQTLISPELDAALVGVPGHRLIVELTEHARVEDYALVKPAVERLRARGIRLAIDDAGAGFSSLQHILHLRPELIKLDRSLTKAIDTDPVRYALAAALVTFARSLDASICAEGIELESELAALQRLGIAFGQGYLLGRPAPLPLAAPPKGLWLCEDEGFQSYERLKVFPTSSIPAAEIATLRPVLPVMLPSPAILDPERLSLLRVADLLDTPPDETFDRVTRWASELLRAPLAMFTLVDDDREFSMSTTGRTNRIPSTRTVPLSHSVCQHVVASNGLIAIADAAQHPLVRENGAVTSLGVAAYLGVPVRIGGKAIGALCVVDVEPRAWSHAEARTLGELAEAIMTELELRDARRRLADRRRITAMPPRSVRVGT